MKVFLKKLLKFILRFLLGVVILIALYVVIAFILSVLHTSPDQVDCHQNEEVYISTNGVHLYLIMPVEQIENELFGLLKIPAEAQFVSFGWGDKAFYRQTPTWGDLKFGVALRAILPGSAAAMHVSSYQVRRSSWHQLMLCDWQIDTLIDHIHGSFHIRPNGEIVRISVAGYPPGDRFYEARGKYSLVKTCNNWVNIGLKKAGVQTSVWSPFDRGVLYHIRKRSGVTVR